MIFVIFLILWNLASYSQKINWDATTPFEHVRAVDNWILTEINDTTPFFPRLQYEFYQTDTADNFIVKVISMVPDSVIFAPPILNEYDSIHIGLINNLGLTYDSVYSIQNLKIDTDSLMKILPSDLIYVLYKGKSIKEVIIDKATLATCWNFFARQTKSDNNSGKEIVEIEESLNSELEVTSTRGHYLDIDTWELIAQLLK